MGSHETRNFTIEALAAAVGGNIVNYTNRRLSCVTTDSRTVEENGIFIPLRGETMDGHAFISMAVEKGAGCIISEAKVPLPENVGLILVPNTLYALGALGKEHKKQCAPFTVGVTGSVGKTTTRQFVNAVLSARFISLSTEKNYNNEIGLPLTLFRLTGEEETLVLEMGMSFKGELSRLSRIATPSVAVITCIGTSHMENLGSREGIRDAKLEILHGMAPGSLLIVPDDEPLLREKIPDINGHGITVLTVGTKTESDYRVENLRMGMDNTVFDLYEKATGRRFSRLTLSAPGVHLAQDAAYAVAVGRHMGLTEEEIRVGLSRYESVGLRQKRRDENGIHEILDCYNASPESMAVSLALLKTQAKGHGGRAVAVLGDMLELGKEGPLLHEKIGASAAGLDALYCVGTLASHIQKGALDAGMPAECVFLFSHTDTELCCQRCASVLYTHLQPNDTVLYKASRGMKLERVAEQLRTYFTDNVQENKKEGK